jgi:glycosyltransferase involved in cell wall biosynthesis
VEQDGPLRVRRVRTFPLPFGYQVRLSSPFPDVLDWLRDVRPDVVHVHHPFPLCAAAVLAARRVGIPLAATNHTIPECALWGLRHTGLIYALSQRAFARWIVLLLKSCTMVATPTRTAAAMLGDLGFRREVSIISNGVDVSRFRPALPDHADHAAEQIRRSLDLGDRPVVLYTGRLDAEKQMDVWLRAAARAALDTDALFVIGGRGGEESRLGQLAADLDIADRVRFPGFLPDEEYASMYRLADLYMILSPVELQSITALEAAASGLPVIAADAGALPELIHNGENGMRVQAGDWRAAGESIVRLLRDPAERRKMGKRSREISLDHDVRRSINTYARFLETAAATRRGRQQPERARLAGG